MAGILRALFTDAGVGKVRSGLSELSQALFSGQRDADGTVRKDTDHTCAGQVIDACTACPFSTSWEMHFPKTVLYMLSKDHLHEPQF